MFDPYWPFFPSVMKCNVLLSLPCTHKSTLLCERTACRIRTRHLVTESVWPANEVPIAIRQAEKIKRQASEEVTYMLPVDPVVVSNHSVESCCLVFCSLLDCYDHCSPTQSWKMAEALSLLRTQSPVSRDEGPDDIRQTLHITNTTHILCQKYTETTDASK